MKKGVFMALVMVMLSVIALGIGSTEVQAALPDLVIDTLLVQDYSAAGVKILITDVTRNKEGAAASASFNRYYLSTDTVIDSLDRVLGRRYVPELPAGAANTGTAYLLIPANVLPGQYYIIVKADALKYVTESREGNNKRFKSIQIFSTVAGALPDLIIASLNAPDSADPGDLISVTDKTKNNGLGGASATVTSIYLSTDAILDSGDKLLAGRYVPPLGPGASDTRTTTVLIPSDTPLDSYYIITKADDPNLNAETDENNNTMSRAITIGTP